MSLKTFFDNLTNKLFKSDLKKHHNNVLQKRKLGTTYSDFSGEKYGCVFEHATIVYKPILTPFGYFNTSTFKEGTVKSGNFDCTVWENGTFEGGMLVCQRWENGTFKGHTIKCCDWIGGDFQGTSFHGSWRDRNAPRPPSDLEVYKMSVEARLQNIESNINKCETPANQSQDNS